MKGSMDSGVSGLKMLFVGTWIAGIYIAVLLW
jgi:hypothetical protein